MDPVTQHCIRAAAYERERVATWPLRRVPHVLAGLLHALLLAKWVAPDAVIPLEVLRCKYRKRFMHELEAAYQKAWTEHWRGMISLHLCDARGALLGVARCGRSEKAFDLNHDMLRTLVAEAIIRNKVTYHLPASILRVTAETVFNFEIEVTIVFDIVA